MNRFRKWLNAPKTQAALTRGYRTSLQFLALDLARRWSVMMLKEPKLSGFISILYHQADAIAGAAFAGLLIGFGVNLRRPVSPESRK